MNHVKSRDGTLIVYDKIGSGPPLILVDGALCDRSSGPNAPLAQLLKDEFTVYIYDRRGRGDSGDAPRYQKEREIEDLDASIQAAGGSAYVYGISSGAALVLEAADRLPSIRRIALYEAPFIVDGSRSPVPDGYLNRMNELLASGRRSSSPSASFAIVQQLRQ